MSEDQDVTLGEVYRLCLEIREEARKTNGRVTALEKFAERAKAYGFLVVLGIGLLLDWTKHKLGIS